MRWQEDDRAGNIIALWGLFTLASLFGAGLLLAGLVITALV
jgi:hypothetical protein